MLAIINKNRIKTPIDRQIVRQSIYMQINRQISPIFMINDFEQKPLNQIFDTYLYTGIRTIHNEMIAIKFINENGG